MAIVNMHEPKVYVVLGIDSHSNDRVLAVCKEYSEAKRYCTECLATSEQFFDLWIEKHAVL